MGQSALSRPAAGADNLYMSLDLTAASVSPASTYFVQRTGVVHTDATCSAAGRSRARYAPVAVAGADLIRDLEAGCKATRCCKCH